MAPGLVDYWLTFECDIELFPTNLSEGEGKGKSGEGSY